MRRQGVRFVATALAAATIVLTGVLTTAATAAPVGCAWLGESDQRDVNIGAPDLDAFYVQDELVPDAASTVTISGRFPYARYFSFHAYDAQGDTLGSIYDQQITAHRGSANPYRRKPPRGARDFYTLHVVFTAAPATRARNTLYVDPAKAGPVATLIYRVYVPRTPSDPSGDVGYPAVTTSHGGQCVEVRSRERLPGRSAYAAGLGCDEDPDLDALVREPARERAERVPRRDLVARVRRPRRDPRPGAQLPEHTERHTALCTCAVAVLVILHLRRPG